MLGTILRGAAETVAAQKVADQVLVVDQPDHRISNWIDISIYGPTRQSVEAAITDYRMKHAGCDPKPAFYHIQGDETQGFRVGGSRGTDPRA